MRFLPPVSTRHPRNDPRRHGVAVEQSGMEQS